MNERSMDERSAEVWARVVAGELASSSAEVREQAERDPALREALGDADGLRGALARAGEDQAAVMREALGQVTDADRELVRAFLRERAGAPGPRARGFRSLRLALAAAAVVAALVWLIPWGDRAGGVTGPLAEPIEGRAFPVGAVTAVDHFRLPEALPIGGSARVSVYDRSASEDAPPVLASPRLTSDRWDLSEDERAALPRRMRWTCELWDGTGEPLPVRIYEAELAE